MKKKNLIDKPTDRRCHLSFSLKDCLLTFSAAFFITAPASGQTFTISSSNPSVAGTTLSASSTNQIIYVLAITASGGGANLSQLKFTLTGTYATSDITKIFIKFNASSDYATSYTASSDLTTIASSGNLNTISLYTPYVSGTSYIWIIADISSSVAGRTMTVSAISASNLTFSSGTCTGTSYASGQFTLGAPAVSEDYSTWSYTKTFTLNTSITGANVSSNNVNFPVLLRLNPGNFSYFSQTLASGADIRFAKTNGVPLRYAIERWVDNTGDNDTAEIWVKIDTVYGNNSTQSFKMYWGMSGAADSSKANNVFDTSNGYIAAYFLNQSSGAAVDYTYNALNGTANGDVPRRQAGMVGYGQSLDGNGDYFNAGSGSKFDVSADDKVTIMAWVKPAGNAVYGTIEGIATKWRWNGTTAYQYALAEDQYNGFFFGLSSSGTDYTFVYDSVGDPPNNGIWYHLAGQMDASKMRIFVNGTARDSTAQTAIAPENSNAQFKIGLTDDDGGIFGRQYFNGVIDFVTLSKTARSPDWIKLCYENQKADQVLVDPENYSTWSHSCKIKINTSGITTTDCYNFPLLIRLNSSNFPFSQAQSAGQDIRFAKSNGMPLPYQIERWDNTNSYAEIWVKIDTVLANNWSQNFTMYWGKSGVSSKSDGNTVFDKRNWFGGTWHFGESSGSLYDATTNSYTCSRNGNITQTSGTVGYGQTFDGSGDYAEIGDYLNMGYNNFTVSAWVKRGATGTHTIAAKTNGGSPSSSYGWIFTFDLDGYLYFYTASGGSAWGDAGSFWMRSSTTLTDLSSWHYVTAVINKTSNSLCKIYIDGTDKSGTVTGSITGVGNIANTLNTRIGSESDGGNQLNGSIDEVRASFTARSADWIRLCYENQKPDQIITDMEDYTTWSHSSNITINTTGITTTNCYAFPLLVRLTSDNFNFSDARSTGQDIRFAKSNGKPLSYQIERWDSTSSTADIWVRIDTVFGNNSSQFFVMYWGKSTVSSKSDASSVFATANGFRCVWHLSEPSGGPTDATLNAYTGTLRNAPSQNQSGIIGKAFTFNPASTQGIYNNSRVVSAFPFTVSTWVKRTAYATDHCLIFLGDKDVNDVSYLTILNTSDHLKVRSQNTTGYFSESSQAIADSAWHLIHTVYKSNTEKIGYIDGVPVCTLTTSVTFSSAVDRFAIGYIAGLAPGNFFKGSLDEFRAEQGERSTDWIRLCYETQKINQLIVTIPRKQLLPITVRNNVGSGTSDTCLVYTDNWSIIFDEDEGGQIKFLSNQSNAAGTNQISATNQRNMFSVEFGQCSYNVSGVLNIMEITPVSVTIGNTYTLSSVTFTEEYTVDGAGRIYLKIRADNNSGSNQTQQLSFLTFRDDVGAAIRKTKTATASTCPYVLNAESYDTNQFDILLSIYDLWTDATTFTSSSNDYSCLGYTDNSFSIANNNRKIWEFMIDFSSKDLYDTSATTNKLSNDYRAPDSLAFYAGTRGMEQTWEHHLYGHWPFESSSGDTAHDLSGNNFNAYSTGTFTTSGRWGNGLQLNGSQSAAIPHNTSFNGDSRFTVMAWIKVASFGASSAVLSKHDGLNGWKLTGNASNQVTLHLGGTQLSGVTNVADNQWHHIAANFTPWENNVTIFVDGKIDAYYPSHYTVTAAATNLTIGSGLTGTIDDVRFYGEHVSESTLKSIYQLGYRSATGAYHLRADNNNAVFFSIDGGTTQHNFPSFTIENYWATSKPAAGCVTLNGSALSENTDYYAYLDDIRNTLKITLNKNISTDRNLLYIDDNYPSGHLSVGATKKMSWGVTTLGTNQYVWVKNFPSNTFGSSTSNEWFINWNMSRSGSAHPSRDGDIWYMASSVEKANTAIDTASSNLIPGSDVSAYYSTLGNLNFVINSVQVRTSENVSNSFTYQIAESSSVRIRLRVNERQVSSSSQSYRVVTEHTIYPTGQIFRYDSLYQFNVAPTTLWAGWFLRDQTNASTYSNKTAKRGAVLYSSGYPDFSAAWLGMRNASGYQAQPFDSDSMTVTTSAYRIGFNFADLTLTSAWNSSSIEISQYCDMQKTTMTSAFVDSTSKSVQNIGLAGGAALAMIKGSLVTTSTGDLNTDGFNERQGAYIINAEDNTVNFKIPSRNDTCRFYPAFVIKNYYAPRKPDYVFGYNGSDTTVLLDGYQYNAYLNSTARELVMQFDSVFCDSAGIYISADKTLAVSISEFLALGGILSDTIRWQTESEQENLGFHIYRRIRPEFTDSIKNILKSSCSRVPLGRAGSLFKSMTVDTADTQWVRITTDLIPGAPAGASVGPVKYQFIDNSVYDSLHYQYKLEAIDFKNREKMYGPVNAMPFALKYLFRLGRNYPNPFRSFTVIHFTLPESMKFSLDIYDLQGRLVRQLIRKDKSYNAGMHRVIWDGTNASGQKAAAGTYIYHLNSKKYKKAFTMLYVGM